MRVLLTGGSGFIAAHVLEELLKNGHSVVTTVRSQEKAEGIKAAHPNIPKSSLDFTIVEDIAQPDAFNEAVKSDPPFEAVVHTASPFHFNATDVQKDLLDPAIKGTKGILHAIQANAPTVKRVVITSSFAAIVNPNKGNWPEHTYTEADWNPITLEEALENAALGYRASKTHAERAAWDFVAKETPNFTLTTLNPPMVFGPVIHHLSSLENLNTSNQRLLSILRGDWSSEIPATATFIWTDVRDLAVAHVRAMEREEAQGKRFFVTAGHYNNAELLGVVRKHFGREYEGKLPPEGTQGGGYPEGGTFKVDNERTRSVLGVRFRGLEECVVDLVKSLRALGA
ncbi:MAG: methylglyoxal reductase (NADPH-dependent) gre2 [Alyxoria varia]|nr:MAG: methylglyoxal reductase (NADPH-dependent) gre2 [Alyxoria varia]